MIGAQSVFISPPPLDWNDRLCLVVSRCGTVHCWQTSPLWSCLSKGHCSRGFWVYPDTTLQSKAMLPCSYQRQEAFLPKKKPCMFSLFSNLLPWTFTYNILRLEELEMWLLGNVSEHCPVWTCREVHFHLSWMFYTPKILNHLSV